MPPKTTSISTEEFLATCFKYCKEKPTVDFAGLSTAIGMSAGGAQNKFRAIMKQFEDDGAVSWAKKTDGSGADTPTDAPKKAPTTKRKAPARKASKTSAVADESADESGTKEEDDADSGLDVVEAPKKKVKAAPKKAATKDAGKGRGRGKKATGAVKAEESVQDAAIDMENNNEMTKTKETVEADEDVDANEIQV